MSLIEQIDNYDHALTVSELGTILQMGKTSIYEMVSRRAIPQIRIGYSIRFDPAEFATRLRERRLKK